MVPCIAARRGRVTNSCAVPNEHLTDDCLPQGVQTEILFTCTRRAWQLFDWVRGLPEGHALQGLCDSNTYTTMITLCGPWQQLRRALQLIADMRSRNIECGFLVSPLTYLK